MLSPAATEPIDLEDLDPVDVFQRTHRPPDDVLQVCDQGDRHLRRHDAVGQRIVGVVHRQTASGFDLVTDLRGFGAQDFGLGFGVGGGFFLGLLGQR